MAVPPRRLLRLLIALALVLAACGSLDSDSSGDATGIDSRTKEGNGSDPDVPATRLTDLTVSEVPLDEVVFDTFDGGSFTLAEGENNDIDRLLDAIAPIETPRYQRAAEATWLTDDELVIGYLGDDGTAAAYAHRILNAHELVTDNVDGRPVIVTYCPLCRSGVVFDRRIDHAEFSGTLEFGNTSALYNNDLVMIDRQTGSYWWQVAGRGIVGSLSGAELEFLPSQTVRWGSWRDAHPDTMVLSNDQGFGRTYRDGFASYADQVNQGRTPFPVEPEVLADTRLASADRIIGVEVDGRAFAIPAENVAAQQVEVADTGIIVELDGNDGGRVIDTETGEPFPSRSSFWFAYLASFPDVEIITPQ